MPLRVLQGQIHLLCLLLCCVVCLKCLTVSMSRKNYSNAILTKFGNLKKSWTGFNITKNRLTCRAVFCMIWGKVSKAYKTNGHHSVIVIFYCLRIPYLISYDRRCDEYNTCKGNKSAIFCFMVLSRWSPNKGYTNLRYPYRGKSIWPTL